MLSRRLLTSRTTAAVVGLVLLALLFYSRALFTGQVLLPGAMLSGFAPFGSDPRAPWNILQWDALGQYYPWRLLVHRALLSGRVPLWNPYQFAGTPLLANAQSAVFYPPNAIFWCCDVAYAFSLSALAHLLLASVATFALARRWGQSRAGALVSAIGFGYGGYLTSWVTLPTLADTAAWLPLLLLLQDLSLRRTDLTQSAPAAPRAPLLFTLVLACALLAGHAQVFFYLLVALLLRAVLVRERLQAMRGLLAGAALAGGLGAAQLLPTLELARLGHRAAQGGASAAGWQFVRDHAVQPADLPSLVVPNWPMAWGSLNENFGYVGIGITVLATACIAFAFNAWRTHARQGPGVVARQELAYPLALTALGLLFALGTPVAAPFYWYVPGLAQMGGVGRALLWWSLGISLVAGLGLTALQKAWPRRGLGLIAVGVVAVELFAAGWSQQTLAPRDTIYPATQVTTWLRRHLRAGQRVLFLTRREQWQPTERFGDGRSHPEGVLPPNGASVYGIEDVNGYDSLAGLRYREYVASAEPEGVSPQWNGNMILLDQNAWPVLDALQVRYIVAVGDDLDTPPGFGLAYVADRCSIYEYSGVHAKPKSGADFYPGWKQGQYQPESFRLGGFISLCFLGLFSLLAMVRKGDA